MESLPRNVKHLSYLHLEDIATTPTYCVPQVLKDHNTKTFLNQRLRGRGQLSNRIGESKPTCYGRRDKGFIPIHSKAFVENSLCLRGESRSFLYFCLRLSRCSGLARRARRSFSSRNLLSRLSWSLSRRLLCGCFSLCRNSLPSRRSFRGY